MENVLSMRLYFGIYDLLKVVWRCVETAPMLASLRLIDIMDVIEAG